MTSLEDPHGLTLKNFEEITTAAAAVTDVYGDDHPLVQRSNCWPWQGSSLVDRIRDYRGEFTLYEQDAETVKESLDAVAEGEAAPAYQPTAQRMLAEYQGIPWIPPVTPGRVATRADYTKKLITEAPTMTEPLQGFIREDRVVLVGFGEVLAAKRAIEDSAHGRAAKRVAATLEAEIANINLAEQPVVQFDGKAATELFNYASQTASHGKAITDAKLGYLIKLGADETAVKNTMDRLPEEPVRPTKVWLEKLAPYLGDLAAWNWIRPA